MRGADEDFLANQHAGFLECLADGGKRKTARACGRDTGLDFGGNLGTQRAAGRDTHIAGIDAPTGEHEFVRLERHLRMALSHQHADAVLVAPHAMMRVAASFGLERGPGHELFVGIKKGFVHGRSSEGHFRNPQCLRPR